jgi:hypothetical protein
MQIRHVQSSGYRCQDEWGQRKYHVVQDWIIVINC